MKKHEDADNLRMQPKKDFGFITIAAGEGLSRDIQGSWS